MTLFCSLMGLACAGELDPRFNTTGAGGTGGQLPAFCDAPATIFVPRCGLSGCHTATSQLNAGLDLSTAATAVDALLNKGPSPTDVATAAECGAAGKPYVQPGTNPATGLLFEKLGGTQTCGTQMPIGLPLEAPDLDCVQRWGTNVANQ